MKDQYELVIVTTDNYWTLWLLTIIVEDINDNNHDQEPGYFDPIFVCRVEAVYNDADIDMSTITMLMTTRAHGSMVNHWHDSGQYLHQAEVG